MEREKELQQINRRQKKSQIENYWLEANKNRKKFVC